MKEKRELFCTKKMKAIIKIVIFIPSDIRLSFHVFLLLLINT